MQASPLGIYAALLSNILFAVVYLYSSWMQPISGTAVFAWRMIAMCLALWLLVLSTRSWAHLLIVLKRIHKNRHWPFLFATTAIIASQLWLFMWAPVNGYGLDIAVGYFLFPLVMVLLGRLFLGEQLNALQWAAVALAAIGVVLELWHRHSFSWVTLWVIATYPSYYLARRLMHVPALPGLLIDLNIIAPFALAWLYWNTGLALPEPTQKYWLLIASLGLLSAIAMQTNLYAAYNLPIALFGMFSYLEPTLLFLIAVVILDENMPPTAVWTYSCIAISIVLLLLNNWLALKKIEAGQNTAPPPA